MVGVKCYLFRSLFHLSTLYFLILQNNNKEVRSNKLNSKFSEMFIFVYLILVTLILQKRH